MAELTCTRCGRTMPPMERPPMAGPWGARVQAAVCADCWKAWQQEQTIVMNHYGLKPFVPSDRQRLYEEMGRFLKLETPSAGPE
jgi:Fe-S cluster biosynthesis and repair protein YggX